MDRTGRAASSKALVAVVFLAAGFAGFFLGLLTPNLLVRRGISGPTKSALPDKNLSPPLEPSPHASPSTSPLPKLTEQFVSERYRYSFRYPKDLTLTRESGDEQIKLVHNGSSFLIFSITTREREEDVLQANFEILKGSLGHFLHEFESGREHGGGHGLPYVCIETAPFGSLGFSTQVGVTCDRPDVYLHLQKGHVLRIETPERLLELPKGRKELIREILRSIDPYL